MEKEIIETNDYIDILDILRRMWAYKLPIIALALVFALLFVVRVEFFVDDQYIASGILYVSNQKENSADYEKSLSQSDIDTARSLNATYREALKTRSFLSEVENEIKGQTDLDYTWKQINSMVSISDVNDTELMRISVSAKSGKDALIIADAMINLAPDKLEQIFDNGTVKIVDEAANSGKVSKGTAKQAVFGMAVGIILAVAVIVIMRFFDTKVRKSEDVAKRYDISILGEIAQ